MATQLAALHLPVVLACAAGLVNAPTETHAADPAEAAAPLLRLVAQGVAERHAVGAQVAVGGKTGPVFERGFGVIAPGARTKVDTMTLSHNGALAGYRSQFFLDVRRGTFAVVNFTLANTASGHDPENSPFHGKLLSACKEAAKSLGEQN